MPFLAAPSTVSGFDDGRGGIFASSSDTASQRLDSLSPKAADKASGRQQYSVEVAAPTEREMKSTAELSGGSSCATALSLKLYLYQTTCSVPCSSTRRASTYLGSPISATVVRVAQT
jgi:hypothetical protein